MQVGWSVSQTLGGAEGATQCELTVTMTVTQRDGAVTGTKRFGLHTVPSTLRAWLGWAATANGMMTSDSKAKNVIFIMWRISVDP